MKLRQGRKVGRTLYLQRGEDVGDNDMLIGIVDTVPLAKLIVDKVNEAGGIDATIYFFLVEIEKRKRQFGSDRSG